MIELVARLTANHGGYFQYSICPLNHAKELETEECFAKYPLKMENGSDIYVLKSRNSGDYKMNAYLPKDLTCEQCVLRYKIYNIEYIIKNNDKDNV